MSVAFAAIDPYVEQNIVLPTEKMMPGQKFVQWGDGNVYPDYLTDLGMSVPTLRSVISGTVDFICGDDVKIQPLRDDLRDGKMNNRGDLIGAQVAALARDRETYGGFALQVIRDYTGAVSEIYYIDIRFLRTNKDCNVFWYCEDWKTAGRKKTVVYPAFIPGLEKKWEELDEKERNEAASSILFVKDINTQVYPAPPYAAAIKACEVERCIGDFHLNSINNAFTTSMIINFNQGTPDDKMKQEIEEGVNEKFCGYQNASRVMLSWNPNKDSATTIESPKVEDFGARYEALSKYVRQQIFTSFRATPVLFGIPTDNNGFAADDYENAFRLYNRTHVGPVQRLIIDAYDRIYGQKDVMEIIPFSMGESDTSDALATQLGVGGTQSLMMVLESETMTIDQKKGALMVLLGLDEESASKILGIPYVAPVQE